MITISFQNSIGADLVPSVTVNAPCDVREAIIKLMEAEQIEEFFPGDKIVITGDEEDAE